MNFITEFFSNKIISATLLSWLVAQILKTILVIITSKTLDFTRLVGSGGMPSSHSSLVSTLVIMTARIEGISSTAFAPEIIVTALTTASGSSVSVFDLRTNLNGANRSE